jgi:hypothetical protein
LQQQYTNQFPDAIWILFGSNAPKSHAESPFFRQSATLQFFGDHYDGLAGVERFAKFLTDSRGPTQRVCVCFTTPKDVVRQVHHPFFNEPILL